MHHEFSGKWITDSEFAAAVPRNVFHRQLQPLDLTPDAHQNRHILFRRRFTLPEPPRRARLYITADDYYKLYLNGTFVAQGPAPSYPFRCGYNEIDVTPYLRPGENVLAVHTLYQGLINRVWVSGDDRHGLLCDLECDGRMTLCSDESFRTHPHTGCTACGIVGYQTQFLEDYDSAAPEAHFADPAFDDRDWPAAQARQTVDYTVVPQQTAQLVFERIAPVSQQRDGRTVTLDFGSCFVGYLTMQAVGAPGSRIRVRCGQELDASGRVRWQLRANCNYEEHWALSGGRDTLDWFDYKSFRYAELELPDGCTIADPCLIARHYPFRCTRAMDPAFAADPALQSVWALCVHSLHYGVQEVIQDCMEREKGFYVGDGCYTALAHLLLTGDDAIVRKLIDDAFASTFITDGMVTCLDCAFMQEIAEYPLMLMGLMVYHCRLCGDRAYLASHYDDAVRLLDVYRRDYERDGLLQNLDKWCVVEWPQNFRDGYDVDLREGRVCRPPHVALNAYYIDAVRHVNEMAELLGRAPYRDVRPMTDAFCRAFYDPARHLFRDSTETMHASYIGNVLAFGFRLYPDDACRDRILDWIRSRGITGVGLFGAVPLLWGMVRSGHDGELAPLLRDENAWRRILREGGTTTFEGWGKDTKWNTSLFHLTMCDAVLFLADVDRAQLYDYGAAAVNGLDM